MTENERIAAREQNKALATKIAREFFASTRGLGHGEARRIAFKYGEWGDESEGGGLIEDAFQNVIFDILNSIETEAEQCQKNATAVRKIRSNL